MLSPSSSVSNVFCCRYFHYNHRFLCAIYTVSVVSIVKLWLISRRELDHHGNVYIALLLRVATLLLDNELLRLYYDVVDIILTK